MGKYLDWLVRHSHHCEKDSKPLKLNTLFKYALSFKSYYVFKFQSTHPNGPPSLDGFNWKKKLSKIASIKYQMVVANKEKSFTPKETTTKDDNMAMNFYLG